MCKLICCKDTGQLLEETILPRLTQGLEVFATFQPHLFIHHETGNLVVVELRRHCPNRDNTPGLPPTHTLISEVFVTGDLAFQAVALGKESMAGHWCMQCKVMRLQFTGDDCELWTMDQLVSRGDEAITNNPVLGVKYKPWWPFIPLQNYVVPLLHCKIGVGNQLLDRLRAIVQEHIEKYSPGEEAVVASIPILQRIVEDATKERDGWDCSVDGGKKQKVLMRAIEAYSKRREIILANNNEN